MGGNGKVLLSFIVRDYDKLIKASHQMKLLAEVNRWAHLDQWVYSINSLRALVRSFEN